MDLVDYSVIKREQFADIYEPSEDTFVLVDALENDLQLIKQLSPTIIVEIGSGSGVVISTLGKELSLPYYLCTDINSLASAATKDVSRSNDVHVEAITSNLLEAFEDRLKNSIDILIFNPPYAVTPSEEVGSTNVFKATSGGERGREVMDRLFPTVPRVLSPRGLFYLTCIVDNDVDDISRCMAGYGLRTTKVLERRCGIERLVVLRFSFEERRVDVDILHGD